MRRLLATALSLAIVLIAAPAAGGHEKFRGAFQTLPAGTALGLDIEGFAKIKLTHDGTVVKAEVRGLEPGRTYAAHLHAGACSLTGNPGGGHYQDKAGGDAFPPNELWLSSTKEDPKAGITADEDGVAHGRGSADWVPRPEPALSVVIHNIDPPGGSTAGGTKIACADLRAAQDADPGDSGDGHDGGHD